MNGRRWMLTFSVQRFVFGLWFYELEGFTIYFAFWSLCYGKWVEDRLTKKGIIE
jgi:hypothetical protein